MNSSFLSNNRYRIILISLIVVLGLILFKELRVYLSSFLGAATLYVLLKGQMVFLVEKANFRKGIAATLLTLEALLLFLIPLTGMALLIIDTLSGFSFDPRAFIEGVNNLIISLEDKLDFKLFTPDNLSFLPAIGTNIIQSLGSGIYSLIINSIFIMFLLFYMLLSYKEFGKMTEEILPFREENKKILTEEARLIIQANAIGIPLLAVIQGVFAYLGYMFFGVENALLYGILTGFASLIPVIGTVLIWGPIFIGILLKGDITAGIGMGLYGFFIIGGVDNAARFLLQKVIADIHPLITIFGVIIGIPMFGFWGLIFGPLLLSLFVLLFNMYRHDFIPGSSAKPRVTTRSQSETPIVDSLIKDQKKRKRKKIQENENKKGN